jgi:hypothetical protein
MRAFKTIRLAGLVLLLLSLVTCSGDFSDGGSPGLRIQALVGNELIISNASGGQENPHVIYLPDKNLYFVVYEDSSSQTSGADIKGRFINPDGTFCGNEITITNAQGNQTLPRAAYRDKDLLQTSSGNDTILVAWQDTRGDANSGYVYFRSIDVTNINLSDCSGISMGSETPVGYTPIQEYSGSTVTIVGPISQNIGTGNGTTKDFNGRLNNYPVVPGSITISVAGTPVCSDNGQGSFSGGCSGSISYESGLFSITFNTAPANGDSVTASYQYFSSWPPGTTSVNDHLLSRKSPKVVYDPVRDLFWITYIESRDTLNRISELCFGFVPVAWNFGVNSFVGYVGLKGADLTVSKGPEIIRNGTTRTTRLISSSHTPLSETYEYEYFISANNPDIGVDTTSPEAFLVFEGIRQKGELRCSCEDKNNNSVCDLADIVTSTFTTSNYDDGLVHIYGLFDKEIPQSVIHSKKIDSSTSKTSYPSIGFDPITKRFLVAWEDMRDGENTKIYGQLIYSGGGLYNQNFILSYQDADGNGQQDPQVANSRQTKPFVSYDSVNQRYFVVWQDGRNGPISLENLDIYGQSVDGEGSLRGSNYFISVAPANQWNPVVAYNSNWREFLAVWKDGRNYSSTGADIYGQRFTLGQPQLTLLKPDNTLLAPPLLNFGSIMKGQSTSLSFKIKNSGDAILKIDCFDPYPLGSPFAYEATLDIKLRACNDNKYIEIIPGADQTFTVYFVPTNSGNFTGSFTIKSDGGNSTISLQGQAGEPNITVSPASLDFGTVSQPISKTFTISNTGNFPLTITGITTTSPYAVSGFTVPLTLAPNETQTVIVTFSPPGGGTFSGQIDITSNDPDTPLQTITLTGRGVNPPDIDVTPSLVDFGTVVAGQSKDITVKIINNITNGADLVISNITVSGHGYTLPTPPSYPITLSAGNTYQVTIKFTPPTSGQFSGSLTISSNDPDEGSFKVDLKGNGSVPPDISVSPASLDFGDVLLYQSKTLTLTISNSGGSNLQITNIQITGAGFSFKTQPQVPVTIQPGGNPVSIEVLFIPLNAQDYTGQITITSNDPDSPTTIQLTGRGISAPNIEVTPASLDFGKVQINTTHDKTVTIKNTGTEVLNISSITIPISQAFTIVSQSPTQVPEGEARNVTVRFSPTGELPYAGNLIISSNDPDTPSIQVPLTGEGTSQAGPGGGGGGENISSKGGGCSIGGAMNKPSQVANMVVLLLPLIFVGLRRFVKGIGGK